MVIQAFVTTLYFSYGVDRLLIKYFVKLLFSFSNLHHSRADELRIPVLRKAVDVGRYLIADPFYHFYNRQTMRLFFIVLFVFFNTNLFAQNFKTHHDSLNNFTIGIPKGWMIVKKLKTDPIALTVRLKRIDEGGLIPSYIVNIINTTNKTLEKYYEDYCRPFDSPNEDHVLISEDNYSTNGINYKWILTKSKSLDLLRRLVYYCYRNGNIYQISFSTDLSGFIKYEQVFKKVIDTFKL